MEHTAEHSNSSNGRRDFIGNTIKIAVLATIASPLQESCKNKSSQKTSATDTSKTASKNRDRNKGQSTRRKKWNQEKLVLNTKTNVIHLPTALMYNYYDQINHGRDVSSNSWESMIQGEIRLNREQSGTILEILSLQRLRNEVNDDSLNSAMNTLAKAFGKEGNNAKGVNLNSKNYRLHELMLQYVALNHAIPAGNKWQAFNERVKKPNKIGKRVKWMESETAFNDRVKYIQDREADYKKRIGQRAAKYTLS